MLNKSTLYLESVKTDKLVVLDEQSGSPKSVDFILWEPWLYFQNLWKAQVA